MIVPSIDLMNGSAVQLVGGKELEIDAGDPRPIADRFGRVGEIAVIDLDAALGKGSNAAIVEELIERAPCRVGGGIRDVGSAIKWLDRGARSVILGTAATPDVLRELPRQRVIAALDARNGEVVDHGWTRGTGRSIEDRIGELAEHVGGFLITFVEREGRLGGLPMDRVRALIERAGDARVTVAGGVRTPEDVAEADAAGADAQVGMALYTGAFDLADALAACLTSDRADGLWPTVVADEHGRTLGLAYSNLKSLRTAINDGVGAYHSRSRKGLWIKGKTSGDTQRLIRIDTDCDRDALRLTVSQAGSGFCHLGTRTCFGSSSGLAALDQTLQKRKHSAEPGSYTQRLFTDTDLLASKLREEAGELALSESGEHAAEEAADLIYFALVAAHAKGATLGDVERVLDRRSLKVTRRPGNAKPEVQP